MSEKIEASSERPIDTTLWCLSISGPDDLVAAPSRKQAVEMAVKFNEMVVSEFEQNPHPYAPLLWATPGSWPGSAESHASSLLADDEYVWLRS